MHPLTMRLSFLYPCLLDITSIRKSFTPEKADIILCVIMVALTAVTIQKYNKKAEVKE